jgi:hypothetical protein
VIFSFDFLKFLERLGVFSFEFLERLGGSVLNFRKDWGTPIGVSGNFMVRVRMAHFGLVAVLYVTMFVRLSVGLLVSKIVIEVF